MTGTEQRISGHRHPDHTIDMGAFNAETSAQVKAAADASTSVDELLLLAALNIESINVALARNRSTPVPVVAAIVADVMTKYADVEPTPPIVDFVFDAAISNGKLSWEMVLAVAELGYGPALALVLRTRPPVSVEFPALSAHQRMILAHHDDPEIQAAARSNAPDRIDLTEIDLTEFEATLSERIRAAKARDAFRSD